MENKVIQFIGTQRSGSNLLRVMLDQFDGIFAPHPPHVLVTFYPLLDKYGDLDSERNFKKLIDDVCILIELNPVEWEGADLDRQKIFDMCSKRTLLEIFIKINELQCLAHNKKIWCCKSMESLYYLDIYEFEKFEPYIIYLYRDGRDVALSFKKAIVGEKHIYNIAKKWKQDQDACLAYIKKIHASRVINVAYEDLVHDPDKIIMHICQVVGLAYKKVTDQYYTSDESKRTAEAGVMWENLKKPVMKDNTRKFMKELSDEEIYIFESVAGDTLQQLGYQLVSQAVSNKMDFTPALIAEYNAVNDQLKKEIKAVTPEHDMLLRKPQSDFVAQIKSVASR